MSMCFLMATVSVCATEADGIRKKLEHAQGAEKLELLSRLCDLSLEEGDYQLQWRCINDYLKESRKQNNNEETSYALWKRLILFYNNDQNDSVIHYAPDDIIFIRDHGKREKFYDTWSCLVNTYVYCGSLATGLKEAEKMYQYAKEDKDDFGSGLACYVMGNAYNNMNNLDEAAAINRQGIEIPGIKLEDVDKVNAEVQEVIDALRINQPEKGKGYPSSGTRNVIACPGARLCPFGCYDTTAFAQKMENNIYPNDRHVKIAFTGCSNDCGKVRMADFGIIGMTEPQYNKDRCVACGACVDYCKRRSVGALQLVNGKVVRDTDKCIGCGVCVVYCPTRAWTRSREHYFRVVLLGRTGKKNPRLAEDFIKWADEESILKMVKNTYAYIEEYIDPNAVEHKEHIGYIVDRTGFEEFKKWIFEGVELGPKAEVNDRIYWGGKNYAKYGG